MTNCQTWMKVMQSKLSSSIISVSLFYSILLFTLFLCVFIAPYSNASNRLFADEQTRLDDDDGDEKRDGQEDDNSASNGMHDHPDEENEQMGKSSEEQFPLREKDDAVIVLRDHTSDSLAVAASPAHATYIITGGMDDVGYIWDLELQRSVAKVDGGNDSVSTVCFSHDGQYAAFGSENGAISIVYMDGSESPASALDGPGVTIHFMTWHPRGPVLLAGSADNVAYMWNAAKGKFLMAFIGHEDAVTCGSFTADGKFVVTGSLDSSLRVWNPTSGETLVRIQTGLPGLRSAFHMADILCLGVGSQETMGEKLIATGCAGGDVFISQWESGQVVTQLPRHEGGVESVKFSPTGMQRVLLASAGADGAVRVWDVENSTERCRFLHGGVIVKTVWHARHPVLASGSSDGTIVLWNVLTGQDLVRLSGHESFITDLCFTSDGCHVASTSADHSVRVFDVTSALASFAEA